MLWLDPSVAIWWRTVQDLLVSAAGLGLDLYKGSRCGAVEGAWADAGRRPATLGGRVAVPGHADSSLDGDPGTRWLGRWSLGSARTSGGPNAAGPY